MDEGECHRILGRHVAQLLEHFDSVRLFVTRLEPGETRPTVISASDGGGNFYAALGQVREWLIQQDHRARIEIEISDREGEDESE